MLRNVYLEGELGEVFTPHFQVECKTTADVFKCLDANYPEFKPYFNKKHEEGGYVHIEACGEELEHSEELLMEVGEGDIIISNIPAGSKAAARIVVGAILVVVGLIIAGPVGYALAAFGKDGPAYLIWLLTRDLQANLAQMGCGSVSELNAEHIFLTKCLKT